MATYGSETVKMISIGERVGSKRAGTDNAICVHPLLMKLRQFNRVI